MIEGLEDSDDVQNVYANFEIADEVLERLSLGALAKAASVGPCPPTARDASGRKDRVRVRSCRNVVQ
jgi:hypothetical protein